jgi:hypothetical protein
VVSRRPLACGRKVNKRKLSSPEALPQILLAHNSNRYAPTLLRIDFAIHSYLNQTSIYLQPSLTSSP